MSQLREEGNIFDCGPSSSTSLKIGSRGGGAEQVGDHDVVIENDTGAVECSPVFINHLVGVSFYLLLT